MNDNFPKRRKTDVTAEMGVNLVSTIFNDEFGWVFRRTHQEHDFGVDGFVDYVTPEGLVTGQFFAVQIKTGESYLSKNGDTHWYSDTKQHLNYFLNLPTPIMLIICDPESKKCFWELLDRDEIDFRGDGWRHPISKSKKLEFSSIGDVKKLFGPINDHVNEFENDQAIFGNLEKGSFVLYSVTKEDIKDRNLSNLKKFLKRITRSEKLTLSVQGKLYICTYGYEHDKREVYQIKEVRKWAKKARKGIEDWYLCANDGDIPSTLIWMAASTCRVDSELALKPDGRLGYLIKGESKELADFMGECFVGLNKATNKWGWTHKYNHNVSKLIQHELFPDIPYPDFDETSPA